MLRKTGGSAQLPREAIAEDELASNRLAVYIAAFNDVLQQVADEGYHIIYVPTCTSWQHDSPLSEQSPIWAVMPSELGAWCLLRVPASLQKA